MKKIYLLWMAFLTLSIMMPKMLFAGTSNADVPDFVEIGGGNVFYKNNQIESDSGIRYFYSARNLNVDISNDYVARYIRLLTGNYNFVQTGYDKKKFNSKRLQATRHSETWKFRYTGSKKVWSLGDGNHIELRRIRNTEDKTASFEVKVAKGLSFAGNYASPRASSNGGKQTCSACGGSGSCSICGGNGYYSVGGYSQPCGACLTSGKCSDCNGTGEV